VDTAGAGLGRYTDPFRLNAPKPHFTSPIPSSVRLLASASLPNHGGTITIRSGRDAQGHTCFRHLHDGKSQQFPTWERTPAIDHHG
jgi:hypothetical protein